MPRPPVPAAPAAGLPGPGPMSAPGLGGATGGGNSTAGSTGDPRVDTALARLDRLDELPVAEHVGEYDAVHRALQDALTAIDES